MFSLYTSHSMLSNFFFFLQEHIIAHGIVRPLLYLRSIKGKMFYRVALSVLHFPNSPLKVVRHNFFISAMSIKTALVIVFFFISCYLVYTNIVSNVLNICCVSMLVDYALKDNKLFIIYHVSFCPPRPRLNEGRRLTSLRLSSSSSSSSSSMVW